MSTDRLPLDGTTALVTGASSGIGAATATALAEEGADVALAARRGDRLDEVADGIEDMGRRAVAVPTDVSEEAEVREMVRTTRDRLGLDVLVNNAGVMHSAPVARADPEDLRQMVEVNLLGLMVATREALPHMLERDSGHVVNVSSVAARWTDGTSPGYAATKAGVDAFSESLRKETADSDVRVTVVVPGGTRTELGRNVTDEVARERLREVVDGTTMMHPDEVAAGIVYAVTQPADVAANELVIRPTDQEW